MTAGWCTRVLRAVMFAAVCVVLAALGHVMMSGSPVAWWALAGAGTGTAGAGWCLACRERGLPFVVSVVVLAQGALHSAFSMAQSLAFAADADAGTGSGAGPAQSGRGAMDVMGVMDGMSMDAMGSMDMSSMDVMGIGSMGMGSMGSLSMDSGTMGSGAMAHLFPWGADAGSPSSFGMFAAHLLAALLCGLWLAHGERAAFRVLRAVVEPDWPRPCGCCSPFRCRRTGRRSGCADARRTAPRAFSFSFTRSLPGVRPWGPLSPETARSPKRHLCASGTGRTSCTAAPHHRTHGPRARPGHGCPEKDTW